MARPRKSRVDELAEIIASGGPVDWDQEMAAAPQALVPRLARLRELQVLGRAFRSLAPLPAGVQAGVADGDSPPLFRWGHLDVRSQIGRGSFGDVYLAIDAQLDRPVALKLWRTGRGRGNSVRRFVEEARGLARVCHPNVVVVHGAAVHRRRAGFWMELIEGETLTARLALHGPCSTEAAIRIGLDLSRALAAVHAVGLVHGDVKAENVMQTASGRTVLMDFGAASRFGVWGQWGDVPFLTPSMAAPEILAGAPPEPTADIYSLGVMLYHLVSASYPVAASSLLELQERHRRGERIALASLCPALSPAFISAVEKAIAGAPEERFQTAGEFEAALRSVLRTLTNDRTPEPTQSLRSLRAELGRVPEGLCLRIAHEIAVALRTIHESGRVHGALDLDGVRLLGDGRVAIDVAALPAGPGPGKREDLRSLGRLLFELAVGCSPDDPPGRVGDFNPQATPYFEGICDRLLRDESPSALTAADLVQVLAEGERGTGWHAHARHSGRDRQRSVRRLRLPRETRLHGREREMSVLLDAWTQAQSGQGRVVLVLGEAGIGKSRLVDELVSQIERAGQPFHFLFGSYPPGGAATATGAFVDAFREQFGADGIEQSLEEYLPRAPRLAKTLGALLDGGPTASDRFARVTMQTAFIQVTQALTTEHPTILAIDDLHFAPDEGRSLFAALAAAASTERLLLIGTSRPELPDPWTAALTRLEHVLTVAPPRLSRPQVTDLLAEALPSTPIPSQFAREIEVRSDGNPFFLLEILRTLRSQTGSSGGASVSFLRNVPIPFSIAQLIVGRMARLESEEDRDLLDVACCAGFRFDPSVVAEATGMGTVPTLRRFGRIEARHRLVRATGSDFVFDHHQVQEFLYAALADPLKQHYHSALAAVLGRREAEGGDGTSDGGGSRLVAICEHELRGRTPARALPLLPGALDYLESHYANDAAIDLLGLALGTPSLATGLERARFLVRRSSRLTFVGRREEAQSALEEAYALVDPEVDAKLRGEIESHLGLQHRIAGKFPEAVRCFESAIQRAQLAGDSRAEGVVRRELGTALYHSGHVAQAEAEYVQALALARRAGHRRDECAANIHLGNLLADAGRFAEAEAPIRSALAGGREAEDAETELGALATLGSMLLDLGRLDDALEVSGQLLDLSQRLGFRSGESLAWVNLGSGLLALGRHTEARSLFEQVVAIAPELRTRNHQASALTSLGFQWGILGDFVRAEEAFREADALRAENEFAWLAGELLFSRGTTAELRGDFDEAERLLDEALHRFVETQSWLGQARARIHRGRVAVQRGNTLDAIAHLEEARRVAIASNAAPESILAELELAFVRNDGVAAAILRFERDETCLSHWERMRARYSFFTRTGDRVHLDAAYRMLQDLRTHRVEDEPAPLEAVALYRNILEEGRAN